MKNGRTIPEGHPLDKELFSVNKVLDIKAKYNINRLIFTHIEEDWGKSYDDYLEMEKKYDNVQFAYDGMTVEV